MTLLRDIGAAVGGAHARQRTITRELRRVAAAEGWLSLAEAEVLYELAGNAERGCIIEVGSYRGRATIALALGAAQGHGARVYTLDPHESFEGALGGTFGPEDRAAFFNNMIKSGCYRNVRLINLSSEIVTPGWQLPVELLWIDGDHAYDGVKCDFACWQPHLADGAHVVFDDSLDERIGPARLIAEILDGGEFAFCHVEGKVTVLRKVT